MYGKRCFFVVYIYARVNSNVLMFYFRIFVFVFVSIGEFAVVGMSPFFRFDVASKGSKVK